ncbi:MAG: hypothetical protein AAFP70_07335 [Calditrichota bacterium]
MSGFAPKSFTTVKQSAPHPRSIEQGAIDTHKVNEEPQSYGDMHYNVPDLPIHPPAIPRNNNRIEMKTISGEGTIQMVPDEKTKRLREAEMRAHQSRASFRGRAADQNAHVHFAASLRSSDDSRDIRQVDVRRRIEMQAARAEARRRNSAATRIQALYRGFRQRRANRLRGAPETAVHFEDAPDAAMPAEARSRILHQMGSLFGVNAIESAEHPSIRVRLGNPDDIREAILAEPATGFAAKAARAVRSSQFLRTAEFPSGKARGVTNKIGGDRVYLNLERLGKPAELSRTGIHEIGHALGLEHPDEADGSFNIMHPTVTGRQRQITTPAQRDITVDRARSKQAMRVLALRREERAARRAAEAAREREGDE